MNELIILIQLLLVQAGLLPIALAEPEKGNWLAETKLAWAKLVDAALDEPANVKGVLGREQPIRIPEPMLNQFIAHLASLGIAVDKQQLLADVAAMAADSSLTLEDSTAFTVQETTDAEAAEEAGDDTPFAAFPADLNDWTDAQKAEFAVWFDETFVADDTEQVIKFSNEAAALRFKEMRDSFYEAREHEKKAAAERLEQEQQQQQQQQTDPAADAANANDQQQAPAAFVAPERADGESKTAYKKRVAEAREAHDKANAPAA